MTESEIGGNDIRGHKGVAKYHMALIYLGNSRKCCISLLMMNLKIEDCMKYAGFGDDFEIQLCGKVSQRRNQYSNCTITNASASEYESEAMCMHDNEIRQL